MCLIEAVTKKYKQEVVTTPPSPPSTLARFNQDLSNIDTFGLDETSVAKGYDYITLFVHYYL
jgi:hypothetical protein